MNKKIFSYIVIGIFTLSQNVFADTNSQYTNSMYETKISSALQGYALYVPSGAKLSAILSQEINSNTATVGQNISAILTDDFTYNGRIIASSGSVVLGSVVSNIKSGMGGKNAQMQIRFTTIRTPYNNTIPISAVIATNDLTGIIKGSSTQESPKEVANNAAADVIAATPIAPASGSLLSRKKNKNTAFNAAFGGGLGVAKTIATKGEDVKIPSNSKINIIFDQPITLGAQ